MGQKVHPIGFRLGVYRDWDARWFAKGSYGSEFLEDMKIRSFIKERTNNLDVSKVIIEKAAGNVRIIIHSSRPGMIIGKKGQGIDRIKNELYSRLKKNIEVSVQEVRSYELNAELVAKSIAEQLERRGSFKRVMKKAGFAAIKGGAKGIKICCAGRLGGAEIARSEWLRLGSVPLHTLRANVDYALAEALTTYGIIGVKVWICKGEF